jgi:putative intracellular protease/amidase
MKKILMVLTSADMMSNNVKTGVWLSEFSEPYAAIVETEHEVTIASINGGVVPIDPKSIGEDIDEAKFIKVLESSINIDDVNVDDFDAVFLPGGHGTMFDLAQSDVLNTKLGEFADQQKVMAAVCHGPSGFLNVKTSDGEYLVKGRTVTGFTNEEEAAVGLTNVMPFLLEDEFVKRNAKYVAYPNWESHVEVDDFVITGQNPQSALAVVDEFLKLV